ncbi:MAG: acyl-CoA dehydrogenase family protein, partial [Bacteroidetes bacterium]|nr:acyl-CoA dehydrogenase family protein [Bacteroidota bacterium]
MDMLDSEQQKTTGHKSTRPETKFPLGRLSLQQPNKTSIMHFQLTEEHEMIRQAARDFAREELLPGVIERDDKQEFPRAQIKKLGELGFMGMMVSEKWGGAGMDTLSYV